VIPGAERVTAHELAKRKVAERMAQEKMQAKKPQQAMDEGLFGEGHKQTDLFAPARKKPDQALIQRQPVERGRSGRPIKTEKIPIGTEEAILEKGYEKATGPREPGTKSQERLAMARERFDKRIERSFKVTFDPGRISEAALQAEPLFAERNSRLAQAQDQLYREGDRRRKEWNVIPEAKQLKFMDDMERGQPVDPKFAGPGEAHKRAGYWKPLKGVAETYRKQLQEAFAMEKLWGSKAAYRQHYFQHIWEKPDQFRAFMDNAHGSTWFQKGRTFDYIQDGLKAGFKLKSTNPEDLMRMRLMAGADMRNTMRLLNDLLAQQQAVPFRMTNRQAQLSALGWKEIVAPDREKWMISPDIQPLWENAVNAKGLWAKEGWAGDAFRAWMGFKNVWVPIRLSMSAFHLLHVTGINMASHAASALGQASRGRLIGATASTVRGISPYVGTGRKGRNAWLKDESARTQQERDAVQLMFEGGFSPMLSEPLRIDASQRLSDALRAGNPFLLPVQVPYHLARRTIQAIQAPLFEHWIPHLKTAAYLQDAAALMRRHPEYVNDATKRKVALTAIRKSVDNRFGEMFYSNLFWNRTVKDLGIGIHLSLGWNLGFAREFIMAAGELLARAKGVVRKPSPTRQVIRDATNKISFVSIYLAQGMIVAAMIGAMLGGKKLEDQSFQDWQFPPAGGLNPDGSERRYNTMWYNREYSMAKKHIEEQGGPESPMAWVKGLSHMWYNKTLIQPIKEQFENKDYYGREIFDPEASMGKQLEQRLKHTLGEQFLPMAVTGAKRVRETGGTKGDEYMAYLGFGPAPSYAAKTATQNRIAHLFQEYEAPGKRPYQDPEETAATNTARMGLLKARQSGDQAQIKEASDAAINAGVKPAYIRETMQGVTSSDRMFKRLKEPQQTAILTHAPEDERAHYLKIASKKTRALWEEKHGKGYAEGGAVDRLPQREANIEDRRTKPQYQPPKPLFRPDAMRSLAPSRQTSGDYIPASGGLNEPMPKHPTRYVPPQEYGEDIEYAGLVNYMQRQGRPEMLPQGPVWGQPSWMTKKRGGIA
jgi:hypothetical protein